MEEDILLRCRKSSYNCARYMGYSHSDSEDIAQDIIIMLLDGSKRYRNTDNIDHWAWRVTKNMIIDDKRKKKPLFSCLDDIFSDYDDEYLENVYQNPLYNKVIGQINCDNTIMAASARAMLVNIDEQEIAIISGRKKCNIHNLVKHYIKKLRSDNGI